MIFSVFAMPFSAGAEVNLSGLNRHQKYYLRLLGSLARADYYETDVLASVTVAQAIYEGGWGAYSLPTGGNNLFGIKAYNNWNGRVYDQTESMLYNSYGDFILSLGQIRSEEISAWRAHDSWAESVRVHSELFTENDNYAPVVGEKDYKVALRAIVNGGYCNDNGYVERAIDILETYGCFEYDDLTPDADGIVALTANTERLYMDIGDTHHLTLSYYPSGKKPSKIKLESDNPQVATIDIYGNIKAVSHGTAFITATLENGREACCIVYVDCDATIIDENVNVRKSPSESSDNLGMMHRGYPVKVASDAIYTDNSGKEYTYVKGYTKQGDLVTGYVPSENVYQKKRNVSSITVVKDDITLTPQQQYTVVASVAPADAVDAQLSWTTSDATVATVSSSGVITAKKHGTAVISAVATGGVTRDIHVTVSNSAQNYKGIVTISDSLRVRSAAAWSAGSVGSVNFLSEVTIIGEPKGYWYEIKGTSTRGKEINGYVFSAYVKLINDDEEIKYVTNNTNSSVYKNANSSSEKVGTLATKNQIAVIGAEKDGWSYVIGKSSSGDGIYGYTKLGETDMTIQGGIEGDNNNDLGNGATISGWYGIVTSQTELNVRDSASTGGNVVGQFGSGSQIIITGEENGWYKVIGNSTDNLTVSGYASAEFIEELYSGTVINIEDNLNVRSEPSTSGEIVGKLYNNDKVTIIGQALDGWYRIETEQLQGFCSADYIQINGKITTEVEDPNSKPDVSDPEVSDPDNSQSDNNSNEDFSITNSDLTIVDGVLCGVSEDTTVSDLCKSFTGNVIVFDKSNVQLEDTAVVGTGATIVFTKNGVSETKATILVMADVNGDGDCSSLDYILVKRCFFGTYNLEGVYLRAGLVSGKEQLNVIDYVMIKRIYFGTYSL